MRKLISLFVAFSIMGAMPVTFADQPTADILKISTLAELEAFRDSVNAGDTCEGKTVTLTADIDMSEKYGEGKESWTPIGINDWTNDIYNLFSGTFDGGNHTISGLYAYTEEEDGAVSFFSAISGTVKNLNVKGSVIANNPSWQNCAAGITVIVDENAQLLNCSFEGIVQNLDYVAGGLVSSNMGLISNCRFNGKVEGQHLVGGIASTGDGTITDCINEGEIIGTVPVGGIAGWGQTIKNCINKGNVTGRTYSQTYTDYESGDEITESIESDTVGGIVGAVYSDSVVENCYNTGAVTGNSEVGGIIGVAYQSWQADAQVLAQVKNCYNVGNITSTMEKQDGEHNIGAIIGSREFNEIDNDDNVTKVLTSEAVNCYYLVGTADKGCGGIAEDTTTALTAAQFASGEAAYLLNGGVSGGDISWFQTIGKDASPVLDNAHLVVWYDGERYYNQATSYGYEITNLYLTDHDGNIIPKPTKSTGFRVHVDVTGEGESRDVYFIAAAYGTNSALIGASCIKDDIPTDKSFSLDMAMQKTEKEISQLKVFAWNFPGNMVAASEVKTLSFPEE